MANRFTVWTDLRVRGTGLNKELKKTKRSFQGLNKAAGGVGNTLKTIFAAGGMFAGISAIGLGIRSLTDDFISMDHAITGAGARFGEDFFRGTEGFEALGAAARQVGADTEFTAAQAAEGLTVYAKAGIDASTAMGLLAGTAVLATNAESEFAEAASVSLDALDAFNMRSKDSAETAKNLARVNDTLTTVVTSAKLDFADFAETLKFAGPVAKATGAELEDMAVLTGLVAKAGIRGSLAGTTLKNTYLGLAAPVGKGAKMLKKLDIEISNSDGTMRDALDILIDFKAATADMGQAQRLAATNAVFGKRAIAGVSKVLSLGVDDLTDYRDKLKESSGAAQKMAKEMRGSIQNRIAKIKSAATEMGLKMFDAFGPKIEGAMASITKWLDNANGNAGEWVETIGDIASGLANVIGFIVDHKEEIKALGKAYLIFKGALAMDTAIQGAISGFKMLAGAQGIGALTTSISGAGGATASARGLGTVLKGIPALLGPIVVALGAGIALGTMLWDSLERNRKKALENANAMESINRGADNDLGFYSDANLKEAEKLQKELLDEEKRSRVEIFGINLNSDEDERQRQEAESFMSKIQAEKGRRRASRLDDMAPFGESAPMRGETVTNKFERKEELIKIDWGTPPPGVSIGLPQPNAAGDLP